MEASETTPTQPTTDELLQQIIEQQAEHRQEVAHLREELAAEKQQRARVTQAQSPVARSAEELAAARLEEINQHDYYCPGCGRLTDYPQQCYGRPEAPHPAIEVVSTDELKQDDVSKHTAAPVS